MIRYDTDMKDIPMDSKPNTCDKEVVQPDIYIMLQEDDGEVD